MLRSTWLAAAIWIGMTPPLHAREHYHAWFRGALSAPVGSKLSLDAELQHRRQNGFNSRYMPDKNLMLSFRGWVHYRQSPDVTFSLSPFAWFSHYRIIQEKDDELAEPGSEIRFSGAVGLQHEIFKRLFIVNRTAAEYRLLAGIGNITRLRDRAGLRYSLTPELKAGLYNELLLNMTGARPQQDRLRAGIQAVASTEDQCRLPADRTFTFVKYNPGAGAQPVPSCDLPAV